MASSTVSPNPFHGVKNEGNTGDNIVARPTKAKSSIWTWSLNQLLNVMRCCNFCNGVCLATFAILAMIPLSGGFPSLTASFTTVTVSAYVTVLGLFMCCVELNLTFIQTRLRKRCGFYFTFIGRAVCIFFSGTMALALISDDSSSTNFYYIVGGATCFNALFNLFMILCHPAFRNASVGITADPWAEKRVDKDGNVIGVDTMEESMAAYVKAHPDLAAKAISTGIAAVGELPREQRVSAIQAASNPFRATVTAAAGSNNPAVVRPAAGATATASREVSFHLGTSYRGKDSENPFA